MGKTVTDGNLTWKMIQAVPSTGKVLTLNLTESMEVGFNTNNPFGTQVQFGTQAPPVPITFAWLATTLQSLIRTVDPSLANATVTVAGSASTANYLQFKSGTSATTDYLYFNGALATLLGISSSVPPAKPSANTNVQQYALGSGTAVQAQALPGATPAQQAGSDGDSPTQDPTGFTLGVIGDAVQKTGLYALMNVDLFNILCIPATMNLPDTEAAQVAAAANDLCETRRAFYILDPPQFDGNRDTVAGIQAWLDANAGLRDMNSALYFPRLEIADALNNFQLRAVAPAGRWRVSTRASTAHAAYGRRRPGRSHALRRAGHRIHAHRRRERGAEPAGDQLPAHLPGLRHGVLGRAHPGRGRPARSSNGSTSRCGAWRCSSRRACTAGRNGWCSSRMTSRCGRRSASTSTSFMQNAVPSGGLPGARRRSMRTS